MITISRYLILLVILQGCRDSAAVIEIRRSQEYAIYSTIVDSICARPIFVAPDLPRNLFLFLRDSTAHLSLNSSYHQQAGPQETDLSGIRDTEVFAILARGLPTFDWQAIKTDFDSSIMHQEPLDSIRLTSRFPCRLISASNIRPILFGLRSPAVVGIPDSVVSKCNGFATFSRIGFNRSLDQALVLINHIIYDGSSDYVIALSKQDQHWVIQCILRSSSI
jgi:hypothetical protein